MVKIGKIVHGGQVEKKKQPGIEVSRNISHLRLEYQDWSKG